VIYSTILAMIQSQTTSTYPRSTLYILALYILYIPGQNNVGRSCSVIWSTVWVVCLVWSSGVDKVCLSELCLSILTVCLLIPRLDVLRC
jgi:hypothetical protein